MTARKTLAVVALAALAGAALRCSDAPLLVIAANRVVLAEAFSNQG